MTSEQKNDKLVSEWKDAIELGLLYKDKTSDHKEWNSWREIYRGNFDRNLYPAVVNRVFSFIKTAIPKIYFRTPSICVTPRRPDLAAHATVVEALDNWLVSETKLKGVMKSAILDAFLCGIGVIKLGYDSEYGYIPEQGVTENAGTVTQAGVEDGNRIEYTSYINEGMPWALRVRPDEIITPFGYNDPNSLPWVAHMFIRPLEDCKQDQKYDRKQRELLKGGFTVDPKNRAFSYFNKGQDAKGQFCLLYEIRDYKRKRMLVISEDRLLIDMDDTLQIDGLPYEFIIFNEDPENFWPIPDVKQMMPAQEEINEIRSQAKRNRRFSLLKFVHAKGSFRDSELAKLISDAPEDAGVSVECETENVTAAVLPLVPHNVTDELIREQQQTSADMRDTMGYSENQMGEYTPFHNKTATEANIVQMGSNIRSDERRDVVADVFANIVAKMNQFVFKYWQTPKVVEICGNDGAQYWIQYTGEELKGEYNLIISPETGMPVSREMRHELAKELFQGFNNDPLIDQVGLRRMVLRQTDLIDPAYQMLIREPQPNPIMGGQLDPNGVPMVNSPQNPIPLQALAGDQGLIQKLMGRLAPPVKGKK